MPWYLDLYFAFLVLSLYTFSLVFNFLIGSNIISMPPQSSRANAGARIAPPPAAGNNDRSDINVSDLCVGCIIWLPSKDSLHDNIKCDKDQCCGGGDLGEGGYNHPVIVLRIKQRPGSRVSGDLICSVACVTTFSDTSLSDYLTKRSKKRHWQRSLPIRDPDAEVTRSYGITYPEELHLDKGRRLSKQSYVRLDHSYEVPVAVLRQYAYREARAHQMRLTKLSYVTLMEELDMEPEVYVKTKDLRKNAAQRLRALVKSVEPVPTPPTRPPTRVPNNIYEPRRPRPFQPANAPSSIPPNTHQYRPVQAETYPSYYDNGYQGYTPSESEGGSSGSSWVWSAVVFLGCTAGFLVLGSCLALWWLA